MGHYQNDVRGRIVAAERVRKALTECGLPVGPCAAWLAWAGPRARDWWVAWFADPWCVVLGETCDDWRALREAGLVAVLVRAGTGRQLRQGKDPFFWNDAGPQDARFGRGETDGVPDEIDPALVKKGVWVSDPEMAMVRWLSATLPWP